jgi:hypothetical protein
MYGIFLKNEDGEELNYRTLKTYLNAAKPKNLYNYVMEKTNGFVFYSISFYADVFKQGKVDKRKMRKDLLDMLIIGNTLNIDINNMNLRINGEEDFVKLYKSNCLTLEDITRIYEAVEKYYPDYYYRLWERLRFENKEDAEQFISIVQDYCTYPLYAKGNCY